MADLQRIRQLLPIFTYASLISIPVALEWLNRRVRSRTQSLQNTEMDNSDEARIWYKTINQIF